MEQFLDVRFSPVARPPTAPGVLVQIVDAGTARTKTFLSAYNRVGAAVKQGQVATINYVTTYGTAAIANATKTFPVRTGVFMYRQAADDLCWLQIGGKAKALVDGTTDVAAGDSLEVLNTGTAFVKDTTARSALSGAIALEAQAANEAVLVDVELIPEQHTIAAS